jgi:hypothetical protein
MKNGYVIRITAEILWKTVEEVDIEGLNEQINDFKE